MGNRRHVALVQEGAARIAKWRERATTQLDLSNVNLGNSDLSDTCLDGANLRGTNLSLVKLDRTTLTGAEYNGKTRWPDRFDAISSGAVCVDAQEPAESEDAQLATSKTVEEPSPNRPNLELQDVTSPGCHAIAEDIAVVIARLQEQKSAIDKLSAKKGKDSWDKLSVIATIISSVLIATVGLAFTYFYQTAESKNRELVRKQQDRHETERAKLRELELVARLLPELGSEQDESTKKRALLTINALGNTQLMAQLALDRPTAGARDALQTVATSPQSTDEDRLVATNALDRIRRLMSCTLHGPHNMTLLFVREDGAPREIEIIGNSSRHIWTVQVGGKDLTPAIQTLQSPGQINVRSGDKITWKVGNGNGQHGIVFPSKADAEALFKFDAGEGQALGPRNELGRFGWGTNSFGSGTILAEATVR